MNTLTRQNTARLRDPAKQPRQTSEEALCFDEGAHPLEEAVRKLYATQPQDLKVELALTRLALDLTLSRLKQEPKPAEFAQLVALIFNGARTIAAIIRVQHTLPSAEDGRRQQQIHAALDALSADWGLDL